jgi:hypothetical protein
MTTARQQKQAVQLYGGTCIMEEKAGMLAWIKAHKKELIIAGISITAIIGVILGIRNRESIMRVWESLRLAITKQPLKAAEVKSMLSTTSAPISVPVIDIVPATEITVIRTTGTAQSHFDVSEHIRNLHDGWHTSVNKIATAVEHGYNLQPGQTWVDSYTKGGIAA